MKKIFLIWSLLYSFVVTSQKISNATISFADVEKAPLYIGCENQDNNAERKKCLNTALRKHVEQNFNTDLADCIEKEYIFNTKKGKSEAHCIIKLPPGNKKINVQFTINELGEIEDINVDAPHPKLTKEGIRIAQLIPKMMAAQHKGKPVKVNYSLPIVFNVK